MQRRWRQAPRDITAGSDELGENVKAAAEAAKTGPEGKEPFGVVGDDGAVDLAADGGGIEAEFGAVGGAVRVEELAIDTFPGAILAHAGPDGQVVVADGGDVGGVLIAQGVGVDPRTSPPVAGLEKVLANTSRPLVGTTRFFSVQETMKPPLGRAATAGRLQGEVLVLTMNSLARATALLSKARAKTSTLGRPAAGA